MYSINHRIGINAPVSAIYQALTTNEGLAQWWTNDVSGAGDVGAIIKFRFNGGGPDFAVAQLITDELVRWQHKGNVPEAWRGTEISFSLESTTEQVFVNFSHCHWQESSDFMAHCNSKWAVFLLSLKALLEVGKGRPFPEDIQIDHA
ncbi:MAG: SRPBCC family protein [Cognaticolwellia sp.]